jgi:hypothetical protein
VNETDSEVLLLKPTSSDENSPKMHWLGTSPEIEPWVLPGAPASPTTSISAAAAIGAPETYQQLRELHFTIQKDDTGYTYDRIFARYLVGAKAVTIEDPYIRAPYQLTNFLRFCETVVRSGSTVRRINLISPATTTRPI